MIICIVYTSLYYNKINKGREDSNYTGYCTLHDKSMFIIT